MDHLNHSLDLIEILRMGYRQDKNGRWVHKGRYGPPKQYIEFLLSEYVKNNPL